MRACFKVTVWQFFKELRCRMLDARVRVIEDYWKRSVGVRVCIYAHASKVHILSGARRVQQDHACHLPRLNFDCPQSSRPTEIEQGGGCCGRVHTGQSSASGQ